MASSPCFIWNIQNLYQEYKYAICDAGHSHIVNSLKNWALANDRIIDNPADVAKVGNSLKNHEAYIFANDQSFEDVKTLTGISACYAFRFDSANAKVLGYENSEMTSVFKSWSPKTKVAQRK
jgi:hypothetical protein